ncbi:MAG TPA: 4-hydroxythreonine-4-phosphate dehydrogenase PdxA [Polyangiaceae bacterium]|jgi:4-hydroxythreonine-4-phosphate dehydrogenase|nr:4-hydroxythreonine-4-phosphate dehydrogenase PdxA [Polyangiaceae bacterium]
MIVVSTGCPAGIGPEVSVLAAAKLRDVEAVLVGDERTLRAAAESVGVAQRRLVAFDGGAARVKNAIPFVQIGPELSKTDRAPGKPSETAGRAQLAYVEAAYHLAKKTAHGATVSGPVSKAAIAHSGARGAASFRGHTEWLQKLDGAAHSVMCFAAPGLVTSLVTTHLPLNRVPRALTAEAVTTSVIELAKLLRLLGKRRPHIAVASLNPHAGESELLGVEESRAIVPGIDAARAVLGRSVKLTGPVGAETAYRKMRGGSFDGVVAMYHDQATIPMKLIAFGDAVNITMGLSVPRTSVDHGTAYDIAWTGKADASGMIAAMKLGEQLAAGRAA